MAQQFGLGWVILSVVAELTYAAVASDWVGWGLTGLSGFIWVALPCSMWSFIRWQAGPGLFTQGVGKLPGVRVEACAASWGPGPGLARWYSHCILHKASWVSGEERSGPHLLMGDAIQSHCERCREKRIMAIFAICHTRIVCTHVCFPLPPLSFYSRRTPYVINGTQSELSVYPVIMVDIYL